MTDSPFETGLPLATTSWDEAEYAAIQSVVESGRFTMGPKVQEFEEAFAACFDSRYGVMVNSGSSANLLAVAALVLDDRYDLRAGDEVLVTAVSWATTYYPLQQYGLIPSFVDIDLDTLNMDLELAQQSVTPRTKAILAVNLLGNPNDYDELTAFCKRNDLILIEDNCESLGARSGGRFAGTMGAMGTFSAFFSHHISTMEGGVILTDDLATSQILMSLRAHGWTRGLPADNAVHPKTDDPWEDLFRFVLPGYNVRPVEMSGAIGIEQVKKIPALIEGRRDNGRYWQKITEGVESIRIQQETGDSSWFGFSMVLEGPLEGRRSELVSAFDRAGIESRPIVAGNFTRNPVMKHLNAKVPESLGAADKVHENGLFVGNHHVPVHANLDRVLEVVTSI